MINSFDYLEYHVIRSVCVLCVLGKGQVGGGVVVYLMCGIIAAAIKF